MIFCFRPCSRRTRWRKKRTPNSLVRLLALLVCIAFAVGLLFLSPQWVLVIIIAVLIVSICVIVSR